MQNPFVYLIAATYQYIVLAYAFLFMACVLSIGIGAFLFQLTVNADIKRNLRSINECAKSQRFGLHAAFNELFDTIQLHSDTKQLVICCFLGVAIKMANRNFKSLFGF